MASPAHTAPAGQPRRDVAPSYRHFIIHHGPIPIMPICSSPSLLAWRYKPFVQHSLLNPGLLSAHFPLTFLCLSHFSHYHNVFHCQVRGKRPCRSVCLHKRIVDRCLGGSWQHPRQHLSPGQKRYVPRLFFHVHPCLTFPCRRRSPGYCGCPTSAFLHRPTSLERPEP